ncbi:hypothetical protein F2Q70_00013022 [Brassica cretica]|uniref:Uncharacterized protein n=1 Tax=Brassica cretica TaxID=69181 RepID=A0A8S9LTS7_BRACR|nr:hypothetical protein F2Q70_00013022 [Brassica cretica]
MVKKTKGKLDAEKQQAERKESALRGKALASEPAGSGAHRTSRQQTLAEKSVAVPTNEESDDESED